MLPRLAIAGAHTDIGKSAVSAALCFGFDFAYFKLVQAGKEEDKDIIASLVPQAKIYPNGFTLQTPASPHIAKTIENVEYNGLQIPLPKTSQPLLQPLLLESAGGLYTPLDSQNCMIDYLALHKLPVLLVGGYYLGAINHILLSIEALKARGIELLGLVMSEGKEKSAHADSFDSFIAQYSGVKIARFRHFERDCENADFQAKALELKASLCALKIL
ncbi:dethiobiotin synthase [Helicobacter sp. MIT 00-7814]|uniref:dethiobiotin synthase n=1 Tax=unclassified Helicobacter TaxID=2593540 RepID=UPI000E1F76F6|nr:MULTISPECIES: dethiobiotin synthase [unclassified Helicobacter]RDU51936.1 dethiobiotin synthase [Helicobacter sp. MIT 99-10781]RDU55037.1 dethiobiotin synthase [Helicobacter sp. MIT 00-7814]